MRFFASTLALLALAGTFLLAQQAQQPGGTPQKVEFDPTKYPEDWLLAKWEKAMSEVTGLEAVCNRVTLDKVFGAKDEYTGKAKYMKTKVASLASLEMTKTSQPEVFEKYICSGNFLYQYIPQHKVIRVHEMPKQGPGQMGDDNLLGFLFGMKAVQAKQRYKLQYDAKASKEGPYYYLHIEPKHDADKADFRRARLTLVKTNFMVAQVWFEEPNGSDITWNFPKIELQPSLKVADFGQPNLPSGWSFQKVPASNGQPKIIHGKQP